MWINIIVIGNLITGRRVFVYFGALASWFADSDPSRDFSIYVRSAAIPQFDETKSGATTVVYKKSKTACAAR